MWKFPKRSVKLVAHQNGYSHFSQFNAFFFVWCLILKIKVLFWNLALFLEEKEYLGKNCSTSLSDRVDKCELYLILYKQSCESYNFFQCRPLDIVTYKYFFVKKCSVWYSPCLIKIQSNLDNWESWNGSIFPELERFSAFSPIAQFWPFSLRKYTR